MARLDDLVELPHGRAGLLARGTWRFRVVEWLADDPYPRARVERLDDGDDGVLPADVEVTVDRLRGVLAAASLAGWEVGQPLAALDALGVGELFARSDDGGGVQNLTAVSFALAGLAPLGPADRQRLLGCRGPRERLGLLAELLADAEAVIRFGLQGEG